MKINLGCGGVYKKNHLNVDAFDSLIADKIMDATDLKLQDNSVDEIMASQIIEHLGITGSIYALSECHRVLKPKGKLIIETPDIRSSFERYLKGDRETRKNILPWIYGVDMPGMQHRFCFPDDLLELILKDNGFVNIEKKFFEYDEDQPVLKIVCKKTQARQAFQIAGHARKKLLKKKLVDIDNQIPAMEIEESIKKFVVKINEFLNSQKEEILEEMTIEGALHSSEITRVFLEELINQKVCSKDSLDRHLKALNFITKSNFSDILISILKEQHNFVGEQEKLFERTCSIGRKIIKDLLISPEKNRKKILDDFLKRRKNINDHEKISFFSEKLIMLRANCLFQKGVKEFNLLNYKKATEQFENSADLYRDQILTYWNLGRLYFLQGNRASGILNYKNALKLPNVINYDNKNGIKKAIEKEMRNQPLESIGEPLVSLYDI